MKTIIFSHFFIYFNKKWEIIEKVRCTKNESLASGKSGKKHFGAYRVIKVKRFIN